MISPGWSAPIFTRCSSIDLIDSAGNDPEYDSIHAKVRGGFFKTLEGNAHIKYPEGMYIVFGTDEIGNDYLDVIDEKDLF